MRMHYDQMRMRMRYDKLYLNYDIIASAFTCEKEPGWQKTEKDWNGFCASNLQNFSLHFQAYCFHSNAWCNLLSNLFELVSEKLSVLSGFDWLYWCSENLTIQDSKTLYCIWWINQDISILHGNHNLCNSSISTVSLDLQYSSFGSCLCLHILEKFENVFLPHVHFHMEGFCSRTPFETEAHKAICIWPIQTEHSFLQTKYERA